MKKRFAFITLLLAAVLLLSSCGSPKPEGKWNVTGGTDTNGDPVKDAFGFFGEHQVEIEFKDNDRFTVSVEGGGHTKDYVYEYKDGKITFTDQDEYISFSGNYDGASVSFNLKIDGKKMTWSLPGTQRVIEFFKE